MTGADDWRNTNIFPVFKNGEQWNLRYKSPQSFDIYAICSRILEQVIEEPSVRTLKITQ